MRSGKSGATTPRAKRGRLNVTLSLQAGAYGAMVLLTGLEGFFEGLGTDTSRWVDLLLGLAGGIFLAVAAAGLYTLERWGRPVVLPGLGLGVIFSFGLVMASFQARAWGWDLALRLLLTVLIALLLAQEMLTRRERDADRGGPVAPAGEAKDIGRGAP